MLALDPYREPRNGKRYNTNTDYEMSEHGRIEGNRITNSSKNTEEEIPEVRVLTHEVVNEQIKGVIAPSRDN